MLVSEVREVLKKYNEEDLRLIVAEMYKSMPKKLKEDKQVDALLQDVQGWINVRNTRRSQVEQVDLISLKEEIDRFVQHAYNQYYFAPNSYVHKNDRPKWRFKTKGFIKDLQVFPVDNEEGKIATDLLQKIYEMLSYACGYYIFRTDSPFGSVGMTQTGLLDLVIARKLAGDVSKESLRSAISMVINSTVDRQTLDSFLISVLVDNLKTPDLRESAIEQCFEVKKEQEKVALSKKGRRGGYDYEYEERRNNLVEMVFRIYMDLKEYDRAISYFKGGYVEHNKEVALFVLLDLLNEYGLKEHWIREYNAAIEKGVSPRESLQEMYLELQ